jgi:hypothetical protein
MFCVESNGRGERELKNTMGFKRTKTNEPHIGVFSKKMNVISPPNKISF